MALSVKAQKSLVIALGSAAAATEFQKLVAARSGTASPDLVRRVTDALASKVAGPDMVSALTSGANLKLNTQKRALIMMAGDATPSGGMEALGNELINYVQTSPLASKLVL